MIREQWLMTGAVALAAFLVMRAWWLQRRESAGDRPPASRSFPRREETAGFVLLVLAALVLVGYLVPGGRLTFLSTWLVSLIIVAATWFGLRARAYRRALPTDDEGQAHPFLHWLREQFHDEWPLLAVLLLGPTIAAPDWIMLRHDRPELALFAFALVAVWWVVDWRSNPDAHPLRNPLRLLADMLRQLWRYKLLLAVLIVCWLASAGLQWAVVAARYPEISEQLAQSGENSRPSLDLALATLHSQMISPQSRVPRVASPSAGVYATWVLQLVLAAWFIWLMWRPPSWLPAAVRERLRWPAHLLVAGTLVAVTIAVLMPESGAVMSFLDYLPLLVVYPLTGPMVAPLDAVALWIVLRIAQHRPWSMRQAARTTAYCWGSVAGLMLLLGVASIVYGSAGWLEMWGLGLIKDICYSGYQLTQVALVLVPWLIVDRRMRLWPAVAESWRLARARSMDVLVFAIRYWLVMMTASVVIKTVTCTPTIVYMLARPPLESFVQLMGVLTIAAAYLALQGRATPAAKLPRSVTAQTRRCERWNT